MAWCSAAPPSNPAAEFLARLNTEDTPPHADVSSAPLVADHHYYLNWAGYDRQPPLLPGDANMPWDELHMRACNSFNLGTLNPPYILHPTSSPPPSYPPPSLPPSDVLPMTRGRRRFPL